MPQHPKPHPMKRCEHCHAVMARQRFNGRLEDNRMFLRRHYCNRACMAAAMTKPVVTSISHSRVKANRDHRGTACSQCGSGSRLAVHHKDENPLNNAPSNLETLCATCHMQKHWQKWKETTRPVRPCKCCGKPARKAWMCQLHYQRWKKYGDPFLTKRHVGRGYQLVRDDSTSCHAPC